MRHAIRSLLRSPGFTLTALLTLALGIGLNTSMFSVLNTLFLRTLPYAEPDTLVRVYRTDADRRSQLPHSPANFHDLRAQNRSFAYMAAINFNIYNLAVAGQPAARLRSLDVTADFFPALGVAPVLGRTFGADEHRPGPNAFAILSHHCWQTRFGADPTLVGRDIRLDGEPCTVLGVMPPGFADAQLWGQVDVFRPMSFPAETLQMRGGNWLTVIARLQKGATLTSAQADLDTIAAQLASAYPSTNARNGIRLVPLLVSGEDPTIRTLTWFTLGLAGCVLLIACANLANLQFARHALRAREHAVRAALGATRLQLVRHSLTESLLLAFVGGALGLLVAVWANSALGARLDLNGRSGLDLNVDWRVLGFAFAAASFTGIGFGLLPAWIASRTDVNDALKQGARGASGGRAQQRIRQSLIVAEVALALVLLSGAGFFLRGLERFTQRDLGWRTDRLLTASLSLPATDYPTNDAQRAFYDQLETRLASLPGVERVAFASALPFFNYNRNQRFVIDGRPDPEPGTEPQRSINTVTPSFFDTAGLPLVEGRLLTSADLSPDGPVRTVINETMAQRFWPNESAVGQRIAHPTDRNARQEIIGVVRDVRFAANIADAKAHYQSYRLLAREPSRSISILLRTAVPPQTLADSVRRAIAGLDPKLPIQDLQPAVVTIQRGLSNFSVIGVLLIAFASLGVLLAALGIYAVVSGFVAQRTREIGIRIALGAQIRDVLRLVVSQGVKLTCLGLFIGLAGAFGVARVLSSFLPALPGPEAIILFALTLALATVAFLASLLPARRATQVDPLISLRAE